MTRGSIEFSQFSLAPRRSASEVAEAIEASSPVVVETNKDVVSASPSHEHAPLLQPHSDEERRQKTARRAAEQQDTRRKLKNLKRSKERNIRFYVNVPLEQDVKARLMRAAHENDVRMTIIMQAAIDTYLKDNGY